MSNSSKPNCHPGSLQECGSFFLCQMNSCAEARKWLSRETGPSLGGRGQAPPMTIPNCGSIGDALPCGAPAAPRSALWCGSAQPDIEVHQAYVATVAPLSAFSADFKRHLHNAGSKRRNLSMTPLRGAFGAPPALRPIAGPVLLFLLLLCSINMNISWVWGKLRKCRWAAGLHSFWTTVTELSHVGATMHLGFARMAWLKRRLGPLRDPQGTHKGTTSTPFFKQVLFFKPSVFFTHAVSVFIFSVCKSYSIRERRRFPVERNSGFQKCLS